MRFICVALASLSLAASLAACGSGAAVGDSQSAQSLLQETFKSGKPIESGKIDLSLSLAQLQTDGSSSSSAKAPQQFTLRLQGRFQSLSTTKLPSFALKLRVGGGGQSFQAGATSASGKLFIEFAGVQFAVPDSTVQAIQTAYARAARSASESSPGHSSSTFATLGVDPGEWLAHPTVVGAAQVAGDDTIHIAAGLDISHFLTDVEKLSSGAGGALGGLSSAGGGTSSPISPEMITALSRSIRDAKVDIYTGAHDHLLRQLSLRATVSATKQTRAVLGSAQSAKLALVLSFAGLNEKQAISAPNSARPLSELPSALERLGLATRAIG